MKVLLLDREILCLTRPKVKHGCDDVEGVPHAQDNFIGIERDLFAERVMSLNEPALVTDFALAAEPIELQTIVKCIVQVTV